MSSQKFEKPIYLLLFGGLGCFLLSFILMGIAPWTVLKSMYKQKQSVANPYYDENGKLSSIGRGKKIYIREACWHCHSQFVRPVAGEPFRYGPSSEAWESMYDVPQMYGTRRVGPDLSREAGRHPNDWHYAHIYNPRFVVPNSVMPGYPELFQKTADGIKPTQEGEDLVAYLQSLGKYYEKEIQEVVYPKLFKIKGQTAATEVVLARGSSLYEQNCIGCHGDRPSGSGKAEPFLKPRAADLIDCYISPSEAYSILVRGVLGSAMPSFREMPEQDLWALAHFVSKMGEDVKRNILDVYENRTQAQLTEGKKLYDSKCITCHGKEGEGDGMASASLNPRPKDFKRRVFGRVFFEKTLREGVPGSAMVSFSGLTQDEIKALHIYVTSLFNENL
jgi:cbb3-type cytochrome c oxidase subunit II